MKGDERMKKKLIFGMSVFIGACILVFGFINSNSAQTKPSLSKEKVKEIVSEQYPGKVSEPILRTINNQPVYEVKTTNDDNAYHIKLDGNSGKILDIIKKPITETKVVAKKNDTKDKKETIQPKKEEKTDSKQITKSKEEPKEKLKEQPKKETPKKEKKTILSHDEVSKIALQQFSGVIDDIELDEENDRLIYEVEIEDGDKEAEIEIDAYTGEIILIEIDEY